MVDDKTVEFIIRRDKGICSICGKDDANSIICIDRSGLLKGNSKYAAAHKECKADWHPVVNKQGKRGR